MKKFYNFDKPAIVIPENLKQPVDTPAEKENVAAEVNKPAEKKSVDVDGIFNALVADSDDE